MEYETTIGLEIHCELKTATKLFCSCENSFGGEPNTRLCPVCLGLPGAMPVLSVRAVELTVRAGLALGCKINRVSAWDRKNYCYPDLPKAWQTTQSFLPLCYGGKLEFEHVGRKKCVRINRIHLEEDAGKLIHENKNTLIDYNRCGVPLIEIVTEPDLHSGAEAVAFLEELKRILKYAGVSDCKMQEGSLRCDINLSVAPHSSPLGVRTETKNLNSFRAVERCCNYESARQIEIVKNGDEVAQETRKWNDIKGVGSAMRSKENAHDYRYFPEPDILPLRLSEDYIQKIKEQIPLLPAERVKKYIVEYGLSAPFASVLTADVAVAELFEKTVELGASPKKTANFIATDILRLAKTQSGDISVGVWPIQLYELLELVEKGKVNLTAAQKELLPELWQTGKSAKDIAKSKGLLTGFTAEETDALVRRVIAQNDRAVSDYRSGNDKVLTFLTGQAMRESKGRANPAEIKEKLIKILSE